MKPHGGREKFRQNDQLRPPFEGLPGQVPGGSNIFFHIAKRRGHLNGCYPHFPPPSI
jgi:hypothetical protein